MKYIAKRVLYVFSFLLLAGIHTESKALDQCATFLNQGVYKFKMPNDRNDEAEPYDAYFIVNSQPQELDFSGQDLDSDIPDMVTFQKIDFIIKDYVIPGNGLYVFETPDSDSKSICLGFSLNVDSNGYPLEKNMFQTTFSIESSSQDSWTIRFFSIDKSLKLKKVDSDSKEVLLAQFYSLFFHSAMDLENFKDSFDDNRYQNRNSVYLKELKIRLVSQQTLISQMETLLANQKEQLSDNQAIAIGDYISQMNSVIEKIINALASDMEIRLAFLSLDFLLEKVFEEI